MTCSDTGRFLRDASDIHVINELKLVLFYIIKLYGVHCALDNNTGGTKNACNNNVNGDTVRYSNDLQRGHGRHLWDTAMSVAWHITPRHVHVINLLKLAVFFI